MSWGYANVCEYSFHGTNAKKKLTATCYRNATVGYQQNAIHLAYLVVEPTHLKNMLVKLDHFPK